MIKWKKGKYGRFEFTITIAAEADNPSDARSNAVLALFEDNSPEPDDYKFEEVKE